MEESVESVLNQTFQDFEIIIVNDGSNDEKSIEILNSFSRPKTRIINIPNAGLGEARNIGIRESNGSYILPLDADDKIEKTYIEKAINILDANTDVGIVYCIAEFFGDRTGIWELPEYSMPDILLSNYIFCSGLFRREDWDRTSGYRKLPGWEDWDFWLSLLELGKKVVKIQEPLFFYRYRNDSMSRMLTLSQKEYIFKELFNQHSQLYLANIGSLLTTAHQAIMRSFSIKDVYSENERLKKSLEELLNYTMHVEVSYKEKTEQLNKIHDRLSNSPLEYIRLKIANFIRPKP